MLNLEFFSKKGEDFSVLGHAPHLMTVWLTSPTPICLTDSAAKGMKRNKLRSVTWLVLPLSPSVTHLFSVLCLSLRPAPCSALKMSSCRPEPEGESTPLEMDDTQRMESPAKKDNDRRPETPMKPVVSRPPCSPASPLSRSKRGKRPRALLMVSLWLKIFFKH